MPTGMFEPMTSRCRGQQNEGHPDRRDADVEACFTTFSKLCSSGIAATANEEQEDDDKEYQRRVSRSITSVVSRVSRMHFPLSRPRWPLKAA
jgi:hypothetical protein